MGSHDPLSPDLPTLFTELCDVSGDEQQARLAEIAEGDPELAAELKELLTNDGPTRGLSYPGLLERVMTPPGPELSPGQHLGRYRLVEVIGTGGMGQVWRAEADFGRSVALKVLRPGLLSPHARRRFEREGAAIWRVWHPNLVACLDVGEHEGVAYLVQELVPGGATLRDTIKQAGVDGELPVSAFRDAADLVARLAGALAEVHEAGTVHRDLKPENVLVTPDGVPKVTDFGLALLEGEPNLTRAGDTPGTPRYMSPEQHRGDKLTVATDIFSLGAILFELLTLRPVFDGASTPRIREQALHGEIPTARSLDRRIPVDLATICGKCLERSPRRRYANMGALEADLRRFLEHLPIEARPPGPVRRAARNVARHRRAWMASATTAMVLIAALTYRRMTKQEEERDFADRVQLFQETIDDLSARTQIGLRPASPEPDEWMSGSPSEEAFGSTELYFEPPTGLDEERPDGAEILAALALVGVQPLDSESLLRNRLQRVVGRAESACFTAFMLLATELRSLEAGEDQGTNSEHVAQRTRTPEVDPGQLLARIDNLLESPTWDPAIRSTWTAWHEHWSGGVPDDPLAGQPHATTVARFWWSQLQRRLGNEEEANVLLIKALREDPGLFAGHYLLAQRLPETPLRTLRERRIEYASNAIVLRPKSSRAWYLFGTLLYRIDEAGARDAFDRARHLDEELSLAHANYAVTVGGEERAQALEDALATRKPYLACYRIAASIHPDRGRRIEAGLAGLDVQGPRDEWAMLRVNLGANITSLLHRKHQGELASDLREAAARARKQLPDVIPWMDDVIASMDSERYRAIVAKAHQVRVLAAQLIDVLENPEASEVSPQFREVALPSAREVYRLAPKKTHDVVTSLASTLSFLSEYEEMYEVLLRHGDLPEVRQWTRNLLRFAISNRSLDPELEAVISDLQTIVSQWDEQYGDG